MLYITTISFSNDTFREYLLFKLSIENISASEYDLKKFLATSVNALGRFVPPKKKFTRGNNMSFMENNM